MLVIEVKSFLLLKESLKLTTKHSACLTNFVRRLKRNINIDCFVIFNVGFVISFTDRLNVCTSQFVAAVFFSINLLLGCSVFLVGGLNAFLDGFVNCFLYGFAGMLLNGELV
jgi:hypothetical protein